MSDTYTPEKMEELANGLAWASESAGMIRQLQSELAAKTAECAELRKERQASDELTRLMLNERDRLEIKCAELRKDAERYRFLRDDVDPNDIRVMIMIDPEYTDKTVDRYMQIWEEDQEKRESRIQYEKDTRYDR